MLAARMSFVGGLFVGGILLADSVSPEPAPALWAGSVGIGCLVVGWLILRSRAQPGWGQLLPQVPFVAAAAVGMGAAAVGFCSLGLRLAAMDRAVAPRWDRQVVAVTGRTITDTVRRSNSSSQLVRTDLIEGRRVSEKLAIRSYGRVKPIELGSTVAFDATVNRLERGDAFDDRLRRKGVVAKAAVAGRMRVIRTTDNPILAAANQFRTQFSRGATSALGERRAGLLLGLVIGDERQIPSKVSDNFRAAGLSHLTAVSGANLAMVLGPLLAMMGAAGAPRRLRIAAGLAVVAMFVVITRWEPSVLRAAVMAAAALSAFLFGRRSHALYLLLAAFVILVAIDPFILWSIGFQLSFAATAGILMLSGSLLALFGRAKENISGRSNVGQSPSPFCRLSQGALGALAVGLSAQAAIFPVIALYFGRISLVAIPANLAAFPLVAPATVLGFAAGLAGLVSDAASAPIYRLAGIFVGALRWVAEVFGGSSAAEVSVPNWKTTETLAAYLVVLGCAIWLAGKKRTARWPFLTAALVLVFAFLAPAAGTPAASGMTTTFFDVGQGDSALVETRAGARVLIDGGPDPVLVASRLTRKGVKRIDVVIFSHAHEDHVAGLKRILERFRVSTVIEPGVADPLVGRVVQDRGAHIAVEGERFTIGDLYVDFLGPGPEQVERANDGGQVEAPGEGAVVNDASIVARVGVGAGCALFTGDIEEEGQGRLLAEHRSQLRCEILKAPHHGSSRLLPEFVSAVGPQWVAVSSGPNKYGHPTDKALSLFESGSARVVRTDRIGDIVLDMDSSGRTALREWTP